MLFFVVPFVGLLLLVSARLFFFILLLLLSFFLSLHCYGVVHVAPAITGAVVPLCAFQMAFASWGAFMVRSPHVGDACRQGLGWAWAKLSRRAGRSDHGLDVH